MRESFHLPLVILLGAGFFSYPAMAYGWGEALFGVSLTIFFVVAYWFDIKHTVMYYSNRRNHDGHNEPGGVPKQDREG